MDLKYALEKLDGEVVGPVGRAEQAMRLAEAEPLDGALLDINLHNGDTLKVAEVLQACGVVFRVTGYRDGRTRAKAVGGG